MQQVTITYKECGVLAALLVILRLKIGKGYVSPAISADQINLVATGTIRLGEESTLVAGCHLQDVACQCNVVIGLKCIDCPINHVFHQGQLMLRLVSIAVTTPDLQEEAEIIVQRTLQLKDPQDDPAPDRQAPTQDHQGDENMPEDAFRPGNRIELGRLQAEVTGQGEVLRRLDSVGYKIVAAFNGSMLRIEREVQEMRDGTGSLQKDVDLHRFRSGTPEDEISKIKSQMTENWRTSEDTRFKKLKEATTTVKTTVAGVRKDLDTQIDSSKQTSSAESVALGCGLGQTKSELQTPREEIREVAQVAKEGMAAAQGYAREVRLLRAEGKQLREGPAAVLSLGDNAFLTQEIEILTNNIHKIGSRANQVEGLQMEFQLLNGRVQRLEGDFRGLNTDLPRVLAMPIVLLQWMCEKNVHRAVSASGKRPRRRRGRPRQTGRRPP